MNYIEKGNFAHKNHFYPILFRVIYLLGTIMPLHFIFRGVIHMQTELDYREIGQNIRRYRMAKGWRQKELAERVSVTEQHVSHIENAYTQLSLPTLVAIANALEVDCNTLLGKTLKGAEKSVLQEELSGLLASMEHDAAKMRLCATVCRAVAESKF